jgi:hypothetical protein
MRMIEKCVITPELVNTSPIRTGFYTCQRIYVQIPVRLVLTTHLSSFDFSEVVICD